MTDIDTKSRDELMVVEGADSSRLLIGFSSGAVYGAPTFELRMLAEKAGCNAILCRDPEMVWYHSGGDGTPGSGISSLVARLASDRDALAPRHVVAMGASMGGYAALLYGHLLAVDVVHAFVPQTCLEPDYVERHERADNPVKAAQYRSLWACPDADWDLFDLRQALARHNGKTRYYVHFCASFAHDRAPAERLRGLPGVHLLAHACHDHRVVLHLATGRLLERLVDGVDPAPDVPALRDAIARAARFARRG